MRNVFVTSSDSNCSSKLRLQNKKTVIFGQCIVFSFCKGVMLDEELTKEQPSCCVENFSGCVQHEIRLLLTVFFVKKNFVCLAAL